MRIIVNICYRDNIVDAQALTIRKKKGKAIPLNVHIDAAIDNTIGPGLIGAIAAHAATRTLTAAARKLHDNPRPPIKGA